MKGPSDSPLKQSDLAEYQRIIDEAKAERAKLLNTNKQQSTFIANLEQK